MQIVKGDAYGLVVALHHVDDDACSALGTQLRIDAEQVSAYAVSCGYPAEGYAFVVAYSPEGSCTEAYGALGSLWGREGYCPASGDVAVVDVYLFAPGRDGITWNIQLGLRQGVASYGREEEVVAEKARAQSAVI